MPIKAVIFRAASFLTDPICKCHECFRRFYVVETPDLFEPKKSKLKEKLLLVLGIVGFLSVAIITTLPGIVLRGLACYLEKKPFIHIKGDGKGKTLPNGQNFSLLSWNICCVGGGYAISDGGVLPWASRIDDIVDKIVEKDADLNCIYETFDIKAAFYICNRLKNKGYKHFYFNIGPKAIGVSSGILIATKYDVKDPEFFPFAQDTMVGRTKFARKGVFSFDLQSAAGSFARVHATHLQHSEECMYPTVEEKAARRKQIELVLKQAKKEKGKSVIVTGDLNLDDDEFDSFSLKHQFKKGDSYLDPDRTWGGDEFCAKMMGKRVSSPLNLDHTMVMAGTARSIRTDLVNSGFDAAKFTRGALSDHAALFSEITVYKPGSLRILFHTLLTRALRKLSLSVIAR